MLLEIKPIHKLQIKAIKARKDKTTSKEKDFLDVIGCRKEATYIQLFKLDQIYKSVVHNSQKHVLVRD